MDADDDERLQRGPEIKRRVGKAHAERVTGNGVVPSLLFRRGRGIWDKNEAGAVWARKGKGPEENRPEGGEDGLGCLGQRKEKKEREAQGREG